MKTELQNKVWSLLPKEFKEEVNEIYLNAVVHHPCGYNHKTDLLKYLFGRHNLTSDVEGEDEMLCVSRKQVQEIYKTSKDIVRIEEYGTKMYSMHIQILCVLEFLFGPKCIPNKDPKPVEPKFNVKIIKEFLKYPENVQLLKDYFMV